MNICVVIRPTATNTIKMNVEEQEMKSTSSQNN